MGSITDAAASKIPIVDLSPFTNPSDNDTVTQAARLETASALVSACRDVGFVYVSNHGVPQADLDRAFALSKAFYDLPTEEKMKAPHPPGWSVHRGYSWPGLEKVSGAISEKDDEEFVKKLREVQDYKVRVYHMRSSFSQPCDTPPYASVLSTSLPLIRSVTYVHICRKATKSAPTPTPTSPTSGRRRLCPYPPTGNPS